MRSYVLISRLHLYSSKVSIVFEKLNQMPLGTASHVLCKNIFFLYISVYWLVYWCWKLRIFLDLAYFNGKKFVFKVSQRNEIAYFPCFQCIFKVSKVWLLFAFRRIYQRVFCAMAVLSIKKKYCLYIDFLNYCLVVLRFYFII